METEILKLLGQADYVPLSLNELLREFQLPRHKSRHLQQILNRLERSGKIARIKKGERYALPLEADLIPGRIRMNRQDVGFLYPDKPGLTSIRIPQDATATAMHG